MAISRTAARKKAANGGAPLTLARKPRSRYIVATALGLGTLTSLFFVSFGAAADKKRLPASSCLLADDFENQTYDRGGARIGIGALADDDVVQSLACPLVRANTSNTNGLSSLDVNLYKEVNSEFRCYAESYDQNGSLLKAVLRTTKQVGRTSLSYGTSLNTSSSKGTYGLYCDLYYESGKFWGDELEAITYNEP